MTRHKPELMDLDTFWNSQLQFSRILPGFQDVLARNIEDSAAFAKSAKLHTLSTGPHDRQWVEWVAGTGTGRVIPVVIHGGYWRALNAEDHRFLMAPLQALGPAVANIEYRLKPGFELADCVNDVARALLTLNRQFPDVTFLLIGHSAGAHLALCAADNPMVAPMLKGVIALSGVYDLRPVQTSALQPEIQLTDAEVATFSLSPSDTRPPVLYVVGADETPEMVRGSALMATRGPAAALMLPRADHITLLQAFARHLDDTMRAFEALGAAQDKPVP